MKYRYFWAILLCMCMIQACKKSQRPACTNSSTEQTFIPTLPSAEVDRITAASCSLNLDVPTELPAADKPVILAMNDSMPASNNNKKNHTTNVTKRVTPTDGYSSDDPNELDFDVENKTGKTIYVTCFTYQRRIAFGHWHWAKSPIYKLDDNQITTIDIDSITDEQDRKHVFGYLAILPTQKEADDAIFELLPDKNKLDLDLIIELKGKKVTINVEKYGSRGDYFEYDFINKTGDLKSDIPELDFAVENKTGKPIFVTCFVYQKKAKSTWLASFEQKDDMAVWRFDKTPIIRIDPGKVGLVDVDTIENNSDRQYVRGYLAIFDEDEEDMAYKSVYELLETNRKLNLGELWRLKNTKIVIEIEKYGIMQDFINYTIKPRSEIDFTKIG